MKLCQEHHFTRLGYWSFRGGFFVSRIPIPVFRSVCAALTALGLAALLPNPAAAQVLDWPLVFDPTVVHHLNLSTMAPADTTCVGPEDPTSWTAIQQDTTFLVELPALFWADGEEGSKLCVSLRQKSNTPLGDPLDPKIALKIDFNQLVPGQRWHLLRKLSLENGDDKDPVSEGIAWQLQRLVAEQIGRASCRERV